MVLNGTDLASYQAGIDPKKIPGDFVAVKATEGTGYRNLSMHSQLATDKIKIIYHFSDGGDWRAEADYFLDYIKPYVGKAVPCLDYEGSAVTTGGPAWAKKWLDYVAQKTGSTPLIYLGLSDENRYNWSSVTKYPLWVAQYNNYNTVYGYQPRGIYGSLRNWKKMTIFQYTSTGRLSGWSGNLDLDVAFISKKQFKALIGGHSSTGGDWELSIHPVVRYDTKAVAIVKNQHFAYLYSDSKLTKRVGKRKRKASFIAYGTKGGAVKVGKNQWFDGRAVIVINNPVADNANKSGTCKVVKGTHAFKRATSSSTKLKWLPVGTKLSFDKRNGKWLHTKEGWVTGLRAFIVL